jgi:glycosyltransferase involved in cell wall biosynthesis/GT2 family glycosyltransferase/uncharacterized coiled-coil protein SlyX
VRLSTDPSYWLKNEQSQNFGDFLSEYYLRHLFIPVGLPCDDLWITGSCISDYHVDLTLRKKNGKVVFWGCGLRDEAGLAYTTSKASRFLAVRGPLTRNSLRLSHDIPIGDPGLLMPALYKPQVCDELLGVSLLVPHYEDQRDDMELRLISGCEMVVRPNLSNDLDAINRFIDCIISADFVLCGSLHAAIVAAAYEKPFGFWNSGNIDVPFKWKDFASSVSIPCNFYDTLTEAKSFYTKSIKDQIKIPILWPLLVSAPMAVRPEVMIKTIELDIRRHGDAVFGAHHPQATSSSIAQNVRHAVESVRLQQAEYSEQIAGLNQTVAERDGQIASLNQTVAERDGQIASLNQTVAERDGQIASLNQTVAERDGQIASLNQTVAERDGQIASLNQTVAERDGQIAGLNQRLTSMESSRSWRMTAPYRWLGRFVKATLGGLAKRGLLSRVVVAMLLLPSAWQYFGGLGALISRFRLGRGSLAEVIADQAVLRERLSSRSPLLRRFVFTTFSLAIRIQRAGSLKRSIRNLLRIVRVEGMAGIRRRMITSATSISEVLVQLGESRPVELPVLAKGLSQRILVADYRVPRPDVSAGERATVGILQDLCALGYEVFFLANDMLSSPIYEDALKIVGVKVVTRDSGFDNSSHYLEEHGSKFGAFYMIRVDVAETLLPVARRVAPDARVIFHAPDLCFLREMREAELRNDLTARQGALNTRDRELAVMSLSDRVVVVSPAEVPVLREVLTDTPISVFPALYVPVVESPRPFAKRNNIFFLGGFGHQPNVSAVQWFVAKVWPHVHEALPDVEFHIIGAEAPDSVLGLGKLPGVKVLGFVPELDPLFEKLRVGVAPLQYGAGIKGKVAMAMGAGIPCVCTDIAAEGMGIKNGVHALVENDPVRFAKAIVTIYEDETTWSRLAMNGQVLVRERYGDVANRASLLKVLNQSQALPIFLFNDYCKAADFVPVKNPEVEAEVDVSIIITAHTDVSLTRACLASVIQTSVGSGVSYELILAGSGDTDEENRALKLFSGAQVIKISNSPNYASFCNRVFDQVRGRHIALLNGKSLVLPGWLEKLYKQLDSDPSIAIVGSKLLNAEEEIIEAGTGLLSNGEEVSIGQIVWSGEENRSARRRELIFNMCRETDFFSRAPILIRRSFWNSVGGLDEGFESNKFASADLALKAREIEMRVMYEPQSEVICYECQQHHVQTTLANADLEAKDREKLIGKWQDVLRGDYLPPGSLWHQIFSKAERSLPVCALERCKNGNLNILYFSPFPSHPSNHGNQATIQQFAKRFQTMGHKVHFALLQSGIYSEDDACAMKNAWDSFEILPNSKPLWSDGNRIAFDGWYQEGLGERIRLLCEKYEIDVVFCSYVFQSKMLEFVPDYILKVIDTHDKMGDRYEMLRKNGQPLEFFSCSHEEEGAYLRRADVVVARREEEARYFDSVTGRKTAIVVPHVEEPHFLERSFDSLKNVGIVASANGINLTIVRECLEAIDSKLDGKDCPFAVHVAGQVKDMAEALSERDGAIFKRPWVRMHGYVQDICKFYTDMDLVVSPVTMGTGINVKTVQAMAFGMPLIATVCGTKGIETGNQLHEHRNLSDLVESLFLLQKNPDRLNELALLSRRRYQLFYTNSQKGFNELFGHKKLTF